VTKLLVTGFGPFPGAPENPTEPLIRALAEELPEKFGASAVEAVVLPTEYRRSWSTLRRLYSSFSPDVVIQFGLNSGAEAIHLECVGRNQVASTKPDANGYAPASTRLLKDGPATIAATFPSAEILAALKVAGFPATLSDDAGHYVCNATLYRSLIAAPEGRRVGFVHVPPASHMTNERLAAAAKIILKVAVMSGF
jgi:pyroglutamyl-peptidase